MSADIAKRRFERSNSTINLNGYFLVRGSKGNPHQTKRSNAFQLEQLQKKNKRKSAIHVNEGELCGCRKD